MTTPDEIRRIIRDELARARADILAESKRNITDSNLDAEAQHGARITHERAATDAKLETLRKSLVASFNDKLKLRRSESPGLDLALRVLATGAALFLFLWLARKGLIL